MDAVRKDVRRLVNKELEAANKRFPQFASPHEGQNVVREELEEAERAIVPLKLYIETRMWNMVKANQTVPKDDFKAIREAAVNLAVEAIQVAAMAKKFEHGQRNNWSGAREDSHGEEKTVPEVETVTITMSRPVAEAVKTACEWYLRLHMGQFWDMADDLCMEKFYSDLENNVYETNEQRENAFDVALHRRDTMREEMEKLYNRCVLPAPISDVMKIPYRAEIVWLVIRHALSWHDNPDGVAGCVSYYAPLNRSDQPQPKIELKLKGKGENHG